MANEAEKVELRGYVDSRLRDIVVADAEKRNIPVSEVVAEAVAAFYDRPDLAAVPRKKIGRPFGMKMGENGTAKKKSKTQKR